jgi:hypothetical protein
MFIDTVMQQLSIKALKGQEAASHYLEALKQAERFRMDNVADYVCAAFKPETDGARDFDVPHEIPNIAPLAEYMWFEMHGDLWEREENTQAGCLFLVVHDTKTDGPDRHHSLPPEARWVVMVTLFVAEPGSFATSNLIHFLVIGADGKPLTFQTGKSPFISQREYEAIKGDPEQKNLSPALITALFAICFCHCKNITIEQELLSRQARRAAERSKTPTLTFKTIDIRPVKKIMTEEGQVESQGIKRALHICRGHFAHYTDEHPLFGKHTGTFYRPMHVRGSLKEEAVLKDYTVHDH